MTAPDTPRPEFEEDAPRVPERTRLIVDLGAYEGPLDLLLDLARDQKVDLARISILKLADQFLEFIAQSRQLRIEVAADYLVMAAWLAWLKSRLLLPDPEPDGEEPSGAEMAARLAWQLRRLEAMRKAGAAIFRRPQLGHDFHRRGAPEGVHVRRQVHWDCSLYDLLQAYGAHCESLGENEPLRVRRDRVVTVEQALERMRRLLGALPEWSSLQAFLPPSSSHPFTRRSAMASTLLAALELARQGDIELRQGRTFGPVFVRRRERAGA